MGHSNYTIRPFNANSTDICAVSTISALGNEYDELALYMTRNIREKWTSYRASCCRWLKEMLLKPGTICWVAEDRSSNEILGWAIWSRHGQSSVAKSWRNICGNDSWEKALERKLWDFAKAYYRYVPGTNPTADQAHRRNLMPVLSEEWPEEIFKEYWVLDGLYVHPEHYRKGIGKALALWGVERGKVEKVPVLVHASPLGRRLYETVGFQVMKRMEGFDSWIDAFKEEGEGEGCWAMAYQYEGGDEVERCRRKYAGEKESAKKATSDIEVVTPAEAISVQ